MTLESTKTGEEQNTIDTQKFGKDDNFQED